MPRQLRRGMHGGERPLGEGRSHRAGASGRGQGLPARHGRTAVRLHSHATALSAEARWEARRGRMGAHQLGSSGRGDREQDLRHVQALRPGDLRAARTHGAPRHGVDRPSHRPYHRNAQQLLRRHPGVPAAPVPWLRPFRQPAGPAHRHDAGRPARLRRRRARVFPPRRFGSRARDAAGLPWQMGGVRSRRRPLRPPCRRVVPGASRHRSGVVHGHDPAPDRDGHLPRGLRDPLDQRAVPRARGQRRPSARERCGARRKPEPLHGLEPSHGQPGLVGQR